MGKRQKGAFNQRGFGVIDDHSYFLLVIDTQYATLYDVFDGFPSYKLRVAQVPIVVWESIKDDVVFRFTNELKRAKLHQATFQRETKIDTVLGKCLQVLMVAVATESDEQTIRDMADYWARMQQEDILFFRLKLHDPRWRAAFVALLKGEKSYGERIQNNVSVLQ